MQKSLVCDTISVSYIKVMINALERKARADMSYFLYQKIRDSEPGRHYLLATLLEGEAAGEKLLFVDGQPAGAETHRNACAKDAAPGEEALAHAGTDMNILPRYALEIGKIQQTCVKEINGSRIFCERIGGLKTLVVCGGGHVAVAVIRFAKAIGFRVVALEDRPLFADHARAAGADEVCCDNFQSSMGRIAGSADTYFAIVTRGHRYDAECLRAALLKPHAYVGMMGSRKRVILLKERLAEEGMDRALLDAVHAPIGLSIGAETPEEIAVSILAELIAVKNQEKRGEGYSPELLSYLTGEKQPKRRSILATIVARRGSAPREIGTKMLIFEDGRTVGTIGGGCMESDIISKSLLMLRQETAFCQLVSVDMTGQAAEDAGMVCGGTIEVFLEEV